MKTKTKKNNYIKVWQKYFATWQKKYKKKFKIDEIQLKEETKYQAQRQLELIEQNRPDKTKTAEEQANKEQLEYINWLKEVLETGKIDYDLQTNNDRTS